ncbi:hypothetical protein [Nitrososphaera sp.]|uniref:hypothetical protein n=1 Tax=Nitrososphaera sp. TaxID=1971748 RepID=UPI00307EDB20
MSGGSGSSSDDGGAKESAKAKSTGSQDRDDMLPPDAALYRVIETGVQVPKAEAGYRLLFPEEKGGGGERERRQRARASSASSTSATSADATSWKAR